MLSDNAKKLLLCAYDYSVSFGKTHVSPADLLGQDAMNGLNYDQIVSLSKELENDGLIETTTYISSPFIFTDDGIAKVKESSI